MATIKKEWRTFINEMNKTGDRVDSYMKAFPKVKSRKTASVNATRLLKNATIKNLLKTSPSIVEEARAKAVEELKEEIKADILTATQKREILHKIATGAHQVAEFFIKRDGTVGSYRRPATPAEIAKAIEIDNRMAGDDAPEKHLVATTTDVTSLYKKALQVKDELKAK